MRRIYTLIAIIFTAPIFCAHAASTWSFSSQVCIINETDSVQTIKAYIDDKSYYARGHNAIDAFSGKTINPGTKLCGEIRMISTGSQYVFLLSTTTGPLTRFFNYLNDVDSTWHTTMNTRYFKLLNTDEGLKQCHYNSCTEFAIIS